jgi:murein DD-endopeptidase MepM/ murein hydrolase activator NlpD
MTRRLSLATLFAFALVAGSAAACGEIGQDDIEQARDEAEDAGDEVVDEIRERLPFEFSRQPLPKDAITAIGWYGYTEDAMAQRDTYAQLQGLHSGVDWFAEPGTQVVSPFPMRGKVLSIGGQPAPHDWRACPNAVAVVYGEDKFVVIYGHLQSVSVEVGEDVDEGDEVGTSGTAQRCDSGAQYGAPHLHMEVMRFDNSAGESQRPANVRTNPVAFFSDDVYRFAEEIAADSGPTARFRVTEGCPSSDPREQPDITPGAGPLCE